MRRPSVPLALLLACFVALHVFYNAAIPLGEGPDEPGHFAYTTFLAREGRLPVQQANPAASDVPGEGHQPPLAYLLATPALLWLSPEQPQIALRSNPDFVWNGGSSPAAFIRGSREYWPWQGTTLAWHIARAVSGLWGLLALVFTFLAGRRLAPDRESPLPLLAAALVAFNPQFLFTTALVSNDALLAALGAALLWLCVRPPLSLAAYVSLGLVFGAALLTKQSALLLGPLLLWAGWRTSAGNMGRFARATLVWGCTALLVAGWWYWRNWQLYGDIFGLAVFRAEFATQPFSWRDPVAWWGALGQLFTSFWARFGWLSLRPPGWMLVVYALIAVVALVGLLRPLVASRSMLIAQGRRLPVTSFMQSPWFAALLVCAMASVWTLAFALTAGLVAWQGRMLFPAIGAIALLLGKGLCHAKRMLWPLQIALFTLALLMPLVVIAPAYQWRVLPPGVAQATVGMPTYARFARSWQQGVELRGWHLGGTQRPATDLSVVFTWHALEPVPTNWTVFVHLLDANEQVVAESNSIPQAGQHPMPLWTAGDWVADEHTLPLPAALPPGSYRLRVGLYRADDDDQERAAAWAADGLRLGDTAELGVVEIK